MTPIQQPPLVTPITPSVPPVNDILQPVAAGTRGVPIFVGAYDAGTTYNQGNIVTYQGSSWSARVTTTGNAPPTLPVEVNAWWFLTARKGDTGAGLEGPQGEAGEGFSSASVVGDNLIITRTSGATFDAGNVRGPKGDTGANGLDGIDGTNGTDGIDGDDGLSAYEVAVANGFVGTQSAWLTSLVGPKGDKGDPGNDGTNGSDGTAATIAVGTVTTLPPGASATVTNVGTSSAAVFDIAIPRGDPGADGEGAGSVTSVAVTVPTGFSVSGSPITTSGTFDIAYASGYQGYTTTEATKLSGIASGATANDTDANLKNRANHTGTQLANTISDFSTAADARVSAAIGSTVQAYSARLVQFAALTDPNADRIVFWDDSAGTMTYLTAGSGLTISGTSMTVSINNANWSGTDLSVANGGTGVSTLTSGAVLIGNGTSAVSSVSPGTTGNVLTSNGSAWVSSAPPASGVQSVAAVATLNNDAAASFSLDATKEAYEFDLTNVIPATDGVNFLVLASTDSGANYTVPLRGALLSRTGTPANSGATIASTTTGAALNILSVGSASNEYGVSIRVRIPRRASGYQPILFEGGYVDANGALCTIKGALEALTTTALTNIRFQYDIGNIESGRIIQINTEAV